MSRPRRVSDLRRALLPVVLVALALGLVVPLGAPGGGVAAAEPRPTIASVQEQVRALETEVENAAEAANDARARLVEVRRRLALLRDRLVAERLDQDITRGRIGELASAVYRGGGLDLDVQVVFATDPEDLLARMAALDQLVTTQRALIERSATARSDLAATEAAVAVQQDQATRLAAAAAAHQRDADAALAQARALLATLQEAERRRLAEIARQERLAAIARAKAAAQALARERAAAAAAAAAERERARQQAERERARQQDDDSDDGDSSSDAGGGGDPQPAGSGRASDAVDAALSVVGHAYVAGGRGPQVFDCSGLTAWAWGRAGVSLVPYSFTQWDQTRRVSRDALRAGDLVFFFELGAHHVGMYIGGGEMVHAASPSRGVIVTSLDDSWYAARLSGYGRVVG